MLKSTRRDFIKSSSVAAIGATLGSALVETPAMAGAGSSSFDIDETFAKFMEDLGGAPGDAGGAVNFVGADPIVRSHFRIGSCMAVPAMAAALQAAAIRRDRTCQTQDLEVDLRESVYNVLPYVGLVLQKKQALGLIDPDDPLPAGFTWRPTVNDRELQLPLLFGNPLSFAFFENLVRGNVMLFGRGGWSEGWQLDRNLSFGLGWRPMQAGILGPLRYWRRLGAAREPEPAGSVYLRDVLPVSADAAVCGHARRPVDPASDSESEHGVNLGRQSARALPSEPAVPLAPGHGERAKNEDD